jgi:NADPH:quinone reductase-like Zn-dependent oxidoreductase
MKAINYEKYGSSSVLKPGGVKKPEPKDNKVFLEIHAIALNAPDWQLLRGPPFITWLIFGLIKPKYQIIEMDLKWTIYN